MTHYCPPPTYLRHRLVEIPLPLKLCAAPKRLGAGCAARGVWRNRISHELVRSNPADDVPLMCCGRAKATEGLAASAHNRMSTVASFSPSVEMITLTTRASPVGRNIAVSPYSPATSTGVVVATSVENLEMRAQRRARRKADHAASNGMVDNPMQASVDVVDGASSSDARAQRRAKRIALRKIAALESDSGASSANARAQQLSHRLVEEPAAAEISDSSVY